MHKYLVFGAVALALSVTGVSSSKAAEDKYDPKIVAAAKKEGKIVVYHSSNRHVLKKNCEVFEKKFGIKTDCTRKSTGGIIKMLTADTMAGVRKCDIISVGDKSMFLVWKAKKELEPYESVNKGNVRQDLLDPDNYHYPARLTYYGISYSTKLVSKDEAPKDWDDIFQDKWKGKIGVVNPRTAGPARLWLSGMIKKYGWGYIEKLSKMKPLLIKSSSTAAKLLVQGEVSLIIPGSEHGVTKRKKRGEPVELVYPKSGLMGKDSHVGICKNAPHPNAARLWIDYETSKEGQGVVTGVGAYPPVREDVEVGFKEIRPSADVYKEKNSNWISVEHLRDEGPKERKKFERIMKAGMGS